MLAAKPPGARSVDALEHEKFSGTARADAIDRALASIEGPVIIGAHNAGVMMIAHWPALRGTREIRGRCWQRLRTSKQQRQRATGRLMSSRIMVVAGPARHIAVSALRSPQGAVGGLAGTGARRIQTGWET